MPAGLEERRGKETRGVSEEGRNVVVTDCSSTTPAIAWRDHGKPQKPKSWHSTLGRQPRSPMCQAGVLTTQPNQFYSRERIL